METNTELDLDLQETAEALLNELNNLQNLSGAMTTAIFFMKSCHLQLNQGTFWDAIAGKTVDLDADERKDIEYVGCEWEEDAVSYAVDAHKSAMKVVELSRKFTKLANF